MDLAVASVLTIVLVKVRSPIADDVEILGLLGLLWLGGHQASNGVFSCIMIVFAPAAYLDGKRLEGCHLPTVIFRYLLHGACEAWPCPMLLLLVWPLSPWCLLVS